MIQKENIRGELETLVIQHPAFAAARARLEALLEDHQAGFEPAIEVLIGPSRSGKTELLKALARKMPSQRENGKLVAPLLFVPVAAGTAPKDLPISVIHALGLPLPRERMRAAELFGFMVSMLKLAQVQLIIFDEASHLVDVGSRTPPRLASDWFKDLHQRAGVSIILSGVYRLQKLLDSNEQLRNRCRRPINLMPYRWDSPADRKGFGGCAVTFLSVFDKHGCPLALDMSTDALIRHLYAASAGHVGLLANVFRELARNLSQPAPLTDAHFRAAVDKLHLPGSGLIRPFSNVKPEDEHLMHILSAELDKYGVVLPPTTAAAELGNAMTRLHRELA